MSNPTRDELKEKANELGIKYPKNISMDKLNKLVFPNEKMKKATKPSDTDTVRILVRNIDPTYPMDVAEVGVNGFFKSIPLDKEVEVEEYFIPSLLNTKWDKAILDDNGQVKEIRMTPRFAIEYI